MPSLGSEKQGAPRWAADGQFARVGAWLALALLAGACGDQLDAPPDPSDGNSVEVDTATVDVDALAQGTDADSADSGDVADARDTAPDAAADADAAPDLDAADAAADATGVDAAADVLPDAATAVDAADAASAVDAADAADAEDTPDAVDAPDAATVDSGPPPCAADGDCVPAAGLAACATAKCVAGACKLGMASDGSPCEDGDPCTHADLCLAGECAQGVLLDCNDGDPCTADTCAGGGCAHTPGSGPCDDGDVCTLGDICKSGSCVPGQVMSCEDGNVCTDNACDPALGCQQAFNAASCTLFDLCQTGAQCNGGTCHAGTPIVCADGNPCTNDLCDPQTGLCQFLMTTTPCDDGNACTSGDLCAGGACLPGASKSCDDGSPCTADSCDGTTGGCVHLANDATCSDGSACTLNDACAGGVCIPGAATGCDDNNPCTDDACGALTGCSHVNNAQACAVGDVCELAQCQAGACVTTGVKGCDDGNPCTTGTCVAPLGCVFSPVPDGATCASATACAGAGTCSAGKCAPGTKTDCSDGNVCTDDLCDPQVKGCYWLPASGACEDGDLCTGHDVCTNGKCLPGTLFGPATNCDDGNVCTDDSCVPATGCQHLANSAACDDGNACTVLEKCASGVCQGGSLSTCEDGNSCTIDVCAPADGTCSWYAKQGSCDDGNPCTVGDSCVGALCSGSAVSCDDGNPCSADACDPTTGVCGHTAVASATVCNDGDACTSKDACVGMTCSGVTASQCSDGNVCTTDLCNAADGSCSFAPATGPCDDGNPCTVGDACAASACVPGATALCDDNNACTLDQCNPATAACTYTAVADGSPCDDGIACTASSACHTGLCAPAVANCTLFADTFECAGPFTGWNLPTATDTDVLWAIDQTPVLPSSTGHGCTLNYNDGVNYCGNLSFYCPIAPTLVAISPTIDASDLHGMPRLAFDTWYQLDGPLPGGTGFGDGKTDVPLVVLRDVTSNQILDQFLLSKSTSACNGPCQSVWRSISLDEPKVAGHVFRVELSLASPSNWGNQGKGWFVDNVAMTREFVPESCANGIDDDGNGKVDCADPVCAGQPGC